MGGRANATTPAAPPAIPEPREGTSRGFDDRGEPYVDERLPDGTIQRTQRRGKTWFTRDGKEIKFIRNPVIQMGAPPHTPPLLPADPAHGRAWVEQHNTALFNLIRTLVRGDEGEMAKFREGERGMAGDDLFKQIVYRTGIAEFLVTAR